MIRAFMLTLAVLAAACGGGPAAPTVIQPRYPNVLGSYRLTFSAVGVFSNGQRSSLTCPGTMAITSQTGGAFSGSLQMTGACANAATINGQMDTAGNISQVVLSNTLDPAGCVISSSTGYTGLFQGVTMTFQRRFSGSCSGLGFTVDQVFVATRQ